MLNARSISTSLLACGFLWTGCGGPEPSTIQAPDRMAIDDAEPFRVDAMALDAAGAPMAAVPVVLAGVGDPTVLTLHATGELRCEKWGRTAVTLQAASLQRDVVVACRLVQEVRGAPQKLVAVLEAADDGPPRPMALGGYAFQAIGLDGRAIPDAVVDVTVDDGGVLVKDPDGSIRAVKPGLGVLSGSLGGHTAELEVSVGLLVSLRKSALVEAGDAIEVPLEQGHYQVSVGADVPVLVGVSAGECVSHEASLAVQVSCVLDDNGTVRIQNPAIRGRGDDAHATVRVVRVP
ncbi:MAG: hypothetical protein CL927_01490 [Deltaproteobacteria bacterium]|nr:hypothetical protein [Deltaproteobacteria bacterium]